MKAVTFLEVEKGLLCMLLASTLLIFANTNAVEHVVRYPDVGILNDEPAMRVAHDHLIRTLEGLQCGGADATTPVATSPVRLVINITVQDRTSVNESFVVSGVRTLSQEKDNASSFTTYAVSIAGQGVLGTVYAMFALGEQCQLQTCSCGEWQKVQAEPSFTLRTLSEEGQLLDLPDVSYRSKSGPSYLNVGLVTSECDYIVSILVPEMLKHGFNSLTILHHDLEEYVTYKYLTNITVYNESDPHLNRSLALGALIRNFTETLQSYHLTVLFQPYEVSCPPVLCKKLKLYAGTPDLQRLLSARYREFFEATNADGIVVTVSDSWSPRGGYEFQEVWRNSSELAKVATAFYNTVVVECKKKLVFRLWLLNGHWDWKGDWNILIDNTPKDLVLSVKDTAGDFLLDSPINHLLEEGSIAPSQRPIMVLIDVFRQYNGWGKTLCYVQQWDERLKQAWKLGVRMINVWGAWSPGCTWPDSGPQLINAPKGQAKSWQGLYNDYRVYTSSPDMPFSPARANAYLIYRLSMNVAEEFSQITSDFASLYFGEENIMAITDALLVTQDGYLQAQSYPSLIRDFVLEWTVVFNPDDSALKKFARETPYSDITDNVVKIHQLTEQLQTAIGAVNASVVPVANGAWSSFQHAANITTLHWLTYATWKDAYYLNHTLVAGSNSTVCQQLLSKLVEWQEHMAAWDRIALQQGEDWQITRVSPKLLSRPDFFRGYVSFNDYMVKIAANCHKVCHHLL